MGSEKVECDLIKIKSQTWDESSDGDTSSFKVPHSAHLFVRILQLHMGLYNILAPCYFSRLAPSGRQHNVF